MLLGISWYLCWLSKASTAKELVKGEVNEIDVLKITVTLCHSAIAEWSPADPDDDEVWDGSRWEWKKTASRLHWKWGWPHSYTPWSVPGEKRIIPYCCPSLFLRKQAVLHPKKRNFSGSKKAVSIKAFQWELHYAGFMFSFLDDKWLT